MVAKALILAALALALSGCATPARQPAPGADIVLPAPPPVRY